MKSSEHLGHLAESLAKAQAEFPPISKDCTAKIRMKSGGEYTFRYADLETILGIVRPILARHGVAILCDVVKAPERLAMGATVRLIHCSGEWIESDRLEVPIEAEAFGRQPAQACGSAATYATRYAVESMLSIRATDDDDGATASGNHIERERRPAPKPEPKPADTIEFFEAKPKPSAPKLAPELAGLLSAFGWPGADRARNADTLLALVGYTLAQCQHSEEAARDAFAALDAKLSEFVGTNDEKLAALWRAAQYGGVEL